MSEEPLPKPTELRIEPELRKALEAILFVIDEPVAVDVLAEVLEVTEDEVEDTLIELAASYVDEGRGFVLRRVGGGWRMYTDPGTARYVETFVLRGRSGRLSQAALETLAIVAYKQPVTRSDISDVRGVDADAGVRNLVSRGLIEEVGREDTPGQPMLYGTTSAFLEKMGMDSVADLPALPDLSPAGPPPPEPAPGEYRSARRELAALDKDDEAIAEAERVDDEVDQVLKTPTPKPSPRLAALLDDPFGDEEDGKTSTGDGTNDGGNPE